MNARKQRLGRVRLVLAITFAMLAVGTVAPAAAGAATWTYVSQIFTPKTGTSFTTLFTSASSSSQPMSFKRFDAVGTLLTTQTLTIGAHGSLQASPAAHSGAPLHVEFTADSPALMMKITYSDSSDVVRTIPVDETRVLGPDAATSQEVSSGFGQLGNLVDGLRAPIDGLRTPIDAVGASVASVGGKAQQRIDELSGQVRQLRSELRSLRRLLVKRFGRARR
jgi:hypothetical protein